MTTVGGRTWPALGKSATYFDRLLRTSKYHYPLQYSHKGLLSLTFETRPGLIDYPSYRTEAGDILLAMELALTEDYVKGDWSAVLGRNSTIRLGFHHIT